ncbi:MAG: hypothetical protein FD136_376 [Chitinophagaceae bacterium]|nr:MAG: hypothetical protein FD136_376 [Chitinophagaceae bacterium]
MNSMKIVVIVLIGLFCTVQLSAQSLNDLLKQPKKSTDTSSSSLSNTFGKLMGGAKGNQAGTMDIANGLKEALVLGAEKGTAMLSKPDGFFANAALKILLPPEAQKIETTLRNIGMGKQVDDAILSMNRAAEEACKTATPIFTNAIKEMTITDAMGILKGSDTAATAYLQQKTTTSLTNSFKPIIENALQKTEATKQWNNLISTYNKFSFKKINPDLAGYVTEKSMSGIYQQIAIEEKEIRKNPLARSTELLKKVFGK